MGERIVRAFGMGMYTLLYFKWITNRDLLYNIWNSDQCHGQPGWERGLGDNSMLNYLRDCQTVFQSS